MTYTTTDAILAQMLERFDRFVRYGSEMWPRARSDMGTTAKTLFRG